MNLPLDVFADWLQGELYRLFLAFVLVVIRLSGLMTTAPAFSNMVVPINVRVLLVLTLGLVVAPLAGGPTSRHAARFDHNGDGWLTLDEIPTRHHARFADALRRHAPSVARDVPQPALPVSRFDASFAPPVTLLEFAWVVSGEFSLGLVLGLGVSVVLSSLQLLGQVIDQQTGVSLGEVLNPDLDANGSLTGMALSLMGTVVYLLIGGHVWLIRAVANSFRELPVGEAYLSVPAIEFLSRLVHHSLALALQAGAPILAAMMLTALAMGYLSHTLPQINLLVTGFPVRVAVGFCVLGLALAGVAARLGDALPEAIHGMEAALAGERIADIPPPPEPRPVP